MFQLDMVIIELYRCFHELNLIMGTAAHFVVEEAKSRNLWVCRIAYFTDLRFSDLNPTSRPVIEDFMIWDHLIVDDWSWNTLNWRDQIRLMQLNTLARWRYCSYRVYCLIYDMQESYRGTTTRHGDLLTPTLHAESTSSAGTPSWRNITWRHRGHNGIHVLILPITQPDQSKEQIYKRTDHAWGSGVLTSFDHLYWSIVGLGISKECKRPVQVCKENILILVITSVLHLSFSTKISASLYHAKIDTLTYSLCRLSTYFGKIYRVWRPIQEWWINVNSKYLQLPFLPYVPFSLSLAKTDIYSLLRAIIMSKDKLTHQTST